MKIKSSLFGLARFVLAVRAGDNASIINSMSLCCLQMVGVCK